MINVGIPASSASAHSTLIEKFNFNTASESVLAAATKETMQCSQHSHCRLYIHDSAATCHFDPSPLDNPLTVDPIRIHGSTPGQLFGSTRGEMTIHSAHAQLICHHTLYVPGLHQGIISGGALAKSGFTSSFEFNGLYYIHSRSDLVGNRIVTCNPGSAEALDRVAQLPPI